MKRRVTPSLIVSIVALVVALGGASYAAIQIPKNSVGTKQLKNKAVNSNKVKNGSLLLKDFKSGQVKPNADEGYRVASDPLDLQTVPASVASVGPLSKGNYLFLARANVVSGGIGTNAALCSLINDAAQNFTVEGVLPLSMSSIAYVPDLSFVSLMCSKVAGSPKVYQGHVIAIPLGKVKRYQSGA